MENTELRQVAEYTQKTELIERLAVVFNRDFTNESIELMLDALDDVSADDLKLAVNLAIKTFQFFPTVAELLTLVEEKLDPARNLSAVVRLDGEAGEAFRLKLIEEEESFFESVNAGA